MTTNAQIGLQTVLALFGGINSTTQGAEGVTFNGIGQANDFLLEILQTTLPEAKKATTYY